MKTCKSPKCSYNVFSKGYCKYHWNIEYGKPIKKISDKQKEIIDEYKIVRDAYMKKNIVCEANFIGCTGLATQCHHKIPKHSKKTWLDDSEFMAVCFNCHDYIHVHDEEARKLGYLKSKL